MRSGFCETSTTVNQTLWSAFNLVKLEATWFSKLETDVQRSLLTRFREAPLVPQETIERIFLDQNFLTVADI